MELILLIVLGVGALIYFGANSTQGSGIVPQLLDTVSTAITGKLSAQDIAVYARSAGFSGDDLTQAVAIALAESNGNPNAYNPETAAGTPQGQGSYGLWQIYLKAHPEFAGFDLYDPLQNANAAYQIWAQSGFGAWSTYKNGAYQAFLDTASQGANA